MNETSITVTEQATGSAPGLIALPIKPENVFHFPDGLPAFEDAKDFVFLCRPETSPFIFMRAVMPGDLGFVCIDPFLVCPDYKPRISDADATLLELSDPADALILSIVTTSTDVRKTTVNLQGPLAINIRTCRGKQVICDAQGYPVRYRIWDALDRLAERERRGSEAEEAEGRRTAA